MVKNEEKEKFVGKSEILVSIKNLIKKYPSADKNAVDDITFNIKKGELFAFLGVNGAGKSTTINILCTLITKTSGEVAVGDFVLGKDDDKIRGTIGVVFQGSVLDKNLTAKENILLRAGIYGLSKEESINRLEELSTKLGMESFLKRTYSRLSGGQRRKVDIARALIAKPSILILDEPTTGLDPQSRIDLWKTIDSLRVEENMTVLLTTHYMEEADNADTVAIIDGGRLLCVDTPQALKSRYSSDEIRLIPMAGKDAEVEKVLESLSIKWEKRVDTYYIAVAKAVEHISIFPRLEKLLESFEVDKGNMDRVFLNVVGRRINDGQF